MVDIRQEAERRYLQRRLDELRQLHDAARDKLASAQAPLPAPESLIQARRRVDRAGQASRVAREAMRAAIAHRDMLLAARPRGIRAVMAWIGGKARQHRQETAEAAQAARTAKDRHEAAEALAATFQAALALQNERAARDRVEATAVRRQLVAVAQREVAVTVEAARLLRHNPGLASSSVRDLLWRADRELLREHISTTNKNVPALSIR